MPSAKVDPAVIKQFERQQNRAWIPSLSIIFWFVFISLYAVLFQVADYMWIGMTIFLLGIFALTHYIYNRCPRCGHFLWHEDETHYLDKAVTTCIYCNAVLKMSGKTKNRKPKPRKSR